MSGKKTKTGTHLDRQRKSAKAGAATAALTFERKAGRPETEQKLSIRGISGTTNKMGTRTP